MSTTNTNTINPGSSGTVVCTPRPNSKLNKAEGHMAACKGEAITVTMGMFFDGTGNNRFNTDRTARSSEEDSVSYKNFYSNVARGWRHYIGSLNGKELKGNSKNGENFNIYIEGIGTSNGDDDDNYGMGLGIGKTGVKNRVRFGAFTAADKIVNHQDVNIEKVSKIEVTFDVFGFSRGATAARHFVHENSTPHPVSSDSHNPVTGDTYYEEEFSSYLEYQINRLSNIDRKIEVKITWRFVGLYETVSSYGPNHHNDINDLGLMTLDHVEKIVHIRALDEYRENFAFTRSTKNNTDVIELLGAHSDIGGGYSLPNAKIKGEKYSEYKRILYKSEEFSRRILSITPTTKELTEKARMTKIMQRFIKEGWYKENKDARKEKPNSINDIKIIDKFLYETPNSRNYEFQIVATRERVETTYSYIPLHIMTERAISFGVHFDNKIKTEYQLDQTLIQVYDRFNNLFINLHNWDPLLKELRYKYLHWSSNYNPVESILDFIPKVKYAMAPTKYNDWFLRKFIN